ncbi:hypothetical protein BB560_003637, partial [Smittium megazygosporum]
FKTYKTKNHDLTTNPLSSVSPRDQDIGSSAAGTEAEAEHFDGFVQKRVSEEYMQFISAFPDGKESVEQQIDMYIIDIFSGLKLLSLIKSANIAAKVHILRDKYLFKKKKKHRPKNNGSQNSAASSHRPSTESTHSNSSSSESSDSGDSSSESSSSDSENGIQQSKLNTSNTPILSETLQNLQYVLDFRIKKGRISSLDISLMRRLCDALLLAMQNESGTFPRKKLSQYSNTAFIIFGGFIEEVKEFRQAVSEKDIPTLRAALLFDKRDDSDSGKDAVVVMMRLVLFCLSDGLTWRDLVQPGKQSGMEGYVEKKMKILDDEKRSLHIVEEKRELYPPPALYSDRNIPKLVTMFNVNINTGLSDESEIQKRSQFYGKNELPKPKKKSVYKIIFEQLTDFMILLLLTAVVATAIAKEYKSAVVLFAVIVLNSIIGTYEEIKASNALDSLKSFTVNSAKVLRKGTISEIESQYLVPGDIVELEEGDSIPADLRLVDTSRLSVIETILTGESVPVLKNTEAIKTRSTKLSLGDCTGNCFMGTLVAKGRGRGIVVRIGSSTEIGKISKAINSDETNRKTPLQKKLKKLGIWLVLIAILLCAFIVVAGVAWGHRFGPMFVSGLALAVSVIPEGLVAVTTVTMALAVRRAAKKNAIVKRLMSVEVLGSITCICSDKTGTLTEGKMGVSEIVLPGLEKFVTQNATNLDPSVGGLLKPGSENFSVANESDKNHFLSASDISLVLLRCLKACILCNNSRVFQKDGEWVGLGDPTEYALLSIALKSGVTMDTLNSNSVSSNEKSASLPKRLLENPFDSERKLMSVVVDSDFNGNSLDVYTKGAPEQVLKISTMKLSNNGTIEKMTNNDLRIISDECTRMAQRGLRVLGLGFKIVDSDEYKNLIDSTTIKKGEYSNENSESMAKKSADLQEQYATQRMSWVESDLIFVGLAGLTDPPRQGVKEAISNCQSAGIKVTMITGDHLVTAGAIAEQLGIINTKVPEMSRSISGMDLDLLSDEALAMLNPFPTVFARVSPDHKLRIVKTLQKMGHIVAMTGDGVNDAPAVRQADIGVAMGIGGTEVTKDASDMVLVDDNFSTIVVAIEEGRKVFDNILKFILYLLSCNTAEIILFLMASVINAELPMSTIMVLWANIIADVPPAMSVGLEPQEKGIMKRPPRNPKSGVLSKRTTVLLMAQATFMALVSFLYYLIALLTPFGTKLYSGLTSEQIAGQPNLILKNNNQVNLDNPVLSLQLEVARSFASITLIVLQLNQAFLSRSVTRSVFKTGILSNKIMVYAVSLSFALLVMGMYVPPIAKWLSLVPLSIYAWLMVLVSVVVQIAFVDLFKILLKRYFVMSESKRFADTKTKPPRDTTPSTLLSFNTGFSNKNRDSLQGKAGALSSPQYLDKGAGNNNEKTGFNNPDMQVQPSSNEGTRTNTEKIEENVESYPSTSENDGIENISPDDLERGQVKNAMFDDAVLSNPGLTAMETDRAYYEKNKIYHWRSDL